ncbi:MAG: hypothetical protein WC598_00310 [Methanoregula sp.]
MTAIENFRSNRKVEQEKINAGQTTAPARSGLVKMLGIPFALAFVFMLNAIEPASAEVDVNLSVITNVINAFVGLISPITNLVIAIVPLWFVIMILGFVMGLLGAILALIKSGMKF